MFVERIRKTRPRTADVQWTDTEAQGALAEAKAGGPRNIVCGKDVDCASARTERPASEQSTDRFAGSFANQRSKDNPDRSAFEQTIHKGNEHGAWVVGKSPEALRFLDQDLADPSSQNTLDPKDPRPLLRPGERVYGYVHIQPTNEVPSNFDADFARGNGNDYLPGGTRVWTLGSPSAAFTVIDRGKLFLIWEPAPK